jgi:hypothetical protein
MFRSPIQTICLALGFALAGYLLSFMTLNSQTTATAQDQTAGEPLRHVVLFKFKADATKEQIEEIVAGFQALPKKIEGITAFEWGTNVSPEGLADGYTHCFVVTFKDAKSRDAYLPHQAHKDFVAILLPRLEKVQVVDYFARK